VKFLVPKTLIKIMYFFEKGAEIICNTKLTSRRRQMQAQHFIDALPLGTFHGGPDNFEIIGILWHRFR
jgi:hypothetical protein